MVLAVVLAADGSIASNGWHGAAFAAGAIFEDCAECPSMIVVPSGRFQMGSPDSEPEHEANESPVHDVTIAMPFAVGRYEVTLGEYKAFMRASRYASTPGCLTNEADVTEFRAKRDYLNPGYKQTDRHPVVCISWNDATAYTQWLSARTGRRYRLLSEAEWEYAARANSKSPFPWGSQVTTGHANYDGQYMYDGGAVGLRRMASLPVGAFKANAFGLYDMAGNVWEWTLDCRHIGYNGAPTDGSPWLADGDGACQNRMRRGGSWDGYAKSVRSANRYWNRTNFRSNYDGFRIARDL